MSGGMLRPKPRPMTNNEAKRALTRRARRAGWKGTAYGKAKRFLRMLERIANENARLDRERAKVERAPRLFAGGAR